MTATAPAAPPSPPSKRRRVRARHVSLAMAIFVVLALVGGIAFVLSEAGLPFVIARVVAQTGGRLSVEGPSGSLAHTMRFRGLAWHGPETTVTASDVVVEWSPMALFSSRLAIDGLGARNVSIALRPSSGATSPPANLTLPLGVSIKHAAVAELAWQAGPRSGRITGLEFGYTGDAGGHAVSALKLVSDFGALAGDATLGATSPFPVGGGVAIVGDGPLSGARLGATLSGTLARIEVAADGTLRDATMKAQTSLTPFAGAAFEQATVALAEVDLAAFVDTLPRTRLTLDFDLSPAAGGVAGAFRASNAIEGPLDDKRIPLASAEGRYAYAQERLSLRDFTATINGGGRARGEGDIDLAAREAPSRWRLAVENLDLARLSTALIATHLSGTLTADVDGGRQSFTGDLSQSSLAVSFAATYAERRIDVSRMRAEAMGGFVSGAGRIALDAPRAFEVGLTAQRFDPSRFGAFPAGSLSGTLKATGTLVPEWKTTASLALAPGSQMKGIALSGNASGTVTHRSLAGAKIDVVAGATKLTAGGSAGTVGDRLSFTLVSPRVAELAPLLPTPLPQSVAGALRASGTLRVEPGGIGGDIDAQGDNLAYGELAAAATVALKASIEPGGAANAVVPLDTRKLSLAVTATELRVRSVAMTRASASATGTLARHTGTLAAAGAGFDVSSAIDGGFAPGADIAN
ncbi:MAG TPA: hypothetical protein VFO33_05580, partial [Casimicrobiaceae bacterium]|nr:hypothetical protein [Casimicrobiaceae bacterium]